MKKNTFLLIVILAVVSIGGFLVIQVFWLGKAFDLSNKQFEHNVNMALLNVSSKLCDINQYELPADPIEQLSSNYFIVNLNNKIAPNLLETILINEFSKRELTEDFEYGIFDCANEEMVYGNLVNISNNNSLPNSFPELNKDAYYFGIYFPNRSSNLVGEMWIWAFSSLVLLIVILFFGFALYTIFRQRQLSEIQRDFINNMTHEFKTPISTIGLSADVLETAEILKQPKRLNQYAKIIKTETNRLQHQVDRILQLATLDTNKIDFKIQSVDCIGLIQQAVDSTKIKIEELEGEIIFSTDEDSKIIRIDSVHFSNIVNNILDNAIKYNHNKPKISIEVKSVNDFLNICISDNGIGVPDKFHALIFKKFYRIPTGNVHDVKGFGLGLFYVKTVVDAHHGSIKIESTSDGSKFIISIPINNG
ncbi:MAG: HAMP domain-containing histidine kinase [Reichenbachiella sp.]